MQIKQQAEWLEQQLTEMKRMIFGANSERSIFPDPAKVLLFELPEVLVPEKQTEKINLIRIKLIKTERKHPLRAEQAAHLPRKVEVIKPENLP